MDWDQIRERCPSVRFVGVACLRDHKLSFTRKSIKRDCGVADVVSENGRKVWGVVYEICDHDVGKLDASEGYFPGRERNSYWRRECLVFLNDDNQNTLTVSTYFAERELNPPLPNTKYKSQILKGARHWHIPEEYISELELIKIGP
jgi:gamma-glutamylcyclotransferase (GGCT)/AIG2-like uncharacterized protein YtfP